MIKTRIAGAAAVFTFGLAALGGTVVAIAAPANADTATTASSDSDARSPHKVKPKQHVLDPTKPQSPHVGQGHKGDTEQQAHPPVIWPGVDVSTTS